MAVYFLRIEDAQLFLKRFPDAELAVAAAFGAARTGN